MRESPSQRRGAMGAVQSCSPLNLRLDSSLCRRTFRVPDPILENAALIVGSVLMQMHDDLDNGVTGHRSPLAGRLFLIPSSP
jgi:hypothetical protein